MLDLTQEDALKHRENIDLLLVTATDTETKALERVLKPLPGLDDLARTHIEGHTYRLGMFGPFPAAHVQCVMGSRKAGSAMSATNEAARCWTPRAVVMAGIAWGSPRVEKLGLGDVLVANSVRDFESARVGATHEHRGGDSEAGFKLLDRFANVNDWEHKLPDGRTSAQYPGLVLSGDKLVANAEFRDKLLDAFEGAIGGDMESYGVAQACRAVGVEWIVVKGVCDWGDENKDDPWQPIAAKAAVSLCLAALRNPSALHDLHPALQRESAVVPPSTEASRCPLEIPPVTDRLVGRESEKGTLIAGLKDESQGMALCFVRGMGGIGKTFLSAEAARAVFAEGAFHDGVVWYEAYEQSPTQIMAHVINALEGAVTSSEPATIQADYRRVIQERRVLIVIDNALSADQVAPLLSDSPGSALLVTSRNHMPTLRRRAVVVLDIEKMADDDAIDLLSYKSGLPRVDHGAALARVATLCGHLPLALSIAGALLAEHDMWPSVESFEERLKKHRLDGLAIDGCPDQDVRAVLLLSYEQMDVTLARVFRSLSVLGRVSFGGSAVAGMLGQDKDRTIADLATLIGRSVLERSLFGRYVMHDLLRDVAEELLDKDEPTEKAAELRHRAAAYWATWQEALSLGTLASAHAKKGDADKAIEYHEKSRVLNEEIGNRQGLAFSLGGLAAAYAKKGDADKAIEYHEKSRVLNEEIGDRRGLASSLGGLGAAFAKKGDADKAIELYEQSQVLNAEIGDRRGQASTLGGLAAVYAKKGDADKAIELYDRAQVLNEEIGDRRGQASALGGLAAVYAKKGDADKAIEYYEKSRVLNEEISDRRGLVISLSGLARAYAKKKDMDKAIEYYEQAASIQRSMGDHYYLCMTLGGMMKAAKSIGNKSLAEKCSLEMEELGHNRR